MEVMLVAVPTKASIGKGKWLPPLHRGPCTRTEECTPTLSRSQPFMTTCIAWRGRTCMLWGERAAARPTSMLRPPSPPSKKGSAEHLTRVAYKGSCDAFFFLHGCITSFDSTLSYFLGTRTVQLEAGLLNAVSKYLMQRATYATTQSCAVVPLPDLQHTTAFKHATCRGPSTMICLCPLPLAEGCFYNDTRRPNAEDLSAPIKELFRCAFFEAIAAVASFQT
eukprot:1157603-Pelagomonas_calceolata.AAC.1